MSNEQKNAFGNQDSALDQSMQTNAPTSNVIEEDDDEEENKQPKSIGPSIGAARVVSTTASPASTGTSVPLATSESYDTDELDSDSAAKNAAAGDVISGIKRTSDAVKYDSTGSAADIYKQTLGITDYDSLRQQVGLADGESFTDYYNRGGYIPTGWETQAKLLLAEERRKKSYSKFIAGEMSEEDFLMEAYGEDILKNNGINRKSVKYWRNRYEETGSFDDPLDNPVFLESVIEQAHTQFESEAWAEKIATSTLADTALSYTATKMTGEQLSAQTFQELFGGTETFNALVEHFGTADKVFTYFRAGYLDANSINPFLDVNGDGNYDYYLHLDGVLYAVDSDTSVGVGNKKAKIFYNTVGATDAESTLDRVRVDGMFGNNDFAEFSDSFIDGFQNIYLGIFDIFGYAVQGIHSAIDPNTSFADANTMWEATKNSSSLLGENNTRTFDEFSWGEMDDISRGIASGVGNTVAIAAEIALHVLLAYFTAGTGNAAVAGGKIAGKAGAEAAEAAAKAAVSEGVQETIEAGAKKSVRSTVGRIVSRGLQVSTGLRSGVWTNVAAESAESIQQNLSEKAIQKTVEKAAKKGITLTTQDAITKLTSRKLAQNYYKRFFSSSIQGALQTSLQDSVQTYASLSAQNEIVKAIDGDTAGYSSSDIFAKASIHFGSSFLTSLALRSVGESNTLTRIGGAMKWAEHMNIAKSVKFSESAQKVFSFSQGAFGKRASTAFDIIENVITMTNSAYFSNLTASMEGGHEAWLQTLISTSINPQSLVMNYGIYNEGVHGNRWNVFGLMRNKELTDPYRISLSAIESLETSVQQNVNLLHKVQAELGIKYPELQKALEKVEADFYRDLNRKEMDIDVKDADGNTSKQKVTDAIAIKLDALGKLNEAYKDMGLTLDSKESPVASKALTDILTKYTKELNPDKTDAEIANRVSQIQRALTQDNNTLPGALIALQRFVVVSKTITQDTQFMIDCYRDAVKSDAKISALNFTSGGFEWVKDSETSGKGVPPRYAKDKERYMPARRAHQQMEKTISSMLQTMNAVYTMDMQTYNRGLAARNMFPDWQPNEHFTELLNSSLNLRNLTELITEGGDKTFADYLNNPKDYPDINDFLSVIERTSNGAGVQVLTVDTSKWNSSAIKGGEGSPEYQAFIKACEVVSTLNPNAVHTSKIEGKDIIFLNPMALDLNVYSAQANLGSAISAFMSLQLAPVNSTEWTRSVELLAYQMFTKDHPYYGTSNTVKYWADRLSVTEEEHPDLQPLKDKVLKAYNDCPVSEKLPEDTTIDILLKKANSYADHNNNTKAKALREVKEELKKFLRDNPDKKVKVVLTPLTDTDRATPEYQKAMAETISLFTYFDKHFDHEAIKNSSNPHLRDTKANLIPFSSLYIASESGALPANFSLDKMELPGGDGTFQSTVQDYISTQTHLKNIMKLRGKLENAESSAEQVTILQELNSSEEKDLRALKKLLQDNPEYFYLCFRDEKDAKTTRNFILDTVNRLNFLTASESGIQDFRIKYGENLARQVLEYFSTEGVSGIAGKKDALNQDTFIKTILASYKKALDETPDMLSQEEQAELEGFLTTSLTNIWDILHHPNVTLNPSSSRIVKVSLQHLQSAEIAKVMAAASSASMVADAWSDDDKAVENIAKNLNDRAVFKQLNFLKNYRETHGYHMNRAFNLDIPEQRNEFKTLMTGLGYEKGAVEGWLSSTIPDDIPGIFYTSRGVDYTMSLKLNGISYENLVATLAKDADEFIYKNIDSAQKLSNAVVLLDAATNSQIYISDSTTITISDDKPLYYDVGKNPAEWGDGSVIRTHNLSTKQGKSASYFKNGVPITTEYQAIIPTRTPEELDINAQNAQKAVRIADYIQDWAKSVKPEKPQMSEGAIKVPDSAVTPEMRELFYVTTDASTGLSTLVFKYREDNYADAVLKLITSNSVVNFSKIFPQLDETRLTRGSVSENFGSHKIKFMSTSDMSEAGHPLFDYMLVRFVQDGFGDAEDFLSLMKNHDGINIGDYTVTRDSRVFGEMSVADALKATKNSKNIHDVMLRTMLEDYMAAPDVKPTALFDPRAREAIGIAINTRSLDIGKDSLLKVKNFSTDTERFRALLADTESIDAIVEEATAQIRREEKLEGSPIYTLNPSNNIEITKADVIEALNLLISKNLYTDYDINGTNRFFVETNSHAKLLSVLTKGENGDVLINLSHADRLDSQDIELLTKYIDSKDIKKVFSDDNALLKRIGWEALDGNEILTTNRRLASLDATVAAQEQFVGMEAHREMLIENKINALKNKAIYRKKRVKLSDIDRISNDNKGFTSMMRTLWEKYTLSSVEHPGSMLATNLRNDVAVQRMVYEVYQTANYMKKFFQTKGYGNDMLTDEVLSELALQISLGTTGTQSTALFNSYYAVIKHADGTKEVKPLAENTVQGDDFVSLAKALVTGDDNTPGILSEKSTDEVLLVYAGKDAIQEGVAPDITLIDLTKTTKESNQARAEMRELIAFNAMKHYSKTDLKTLASTLNMDGTDNLVAIAVAKWISSAESTQDMYEYLKEGFEAIAPSDELRPMMAYLARLTLPTIQSIASGKEGNSLQAEAFRNVRRQMGNNLDILINTEGSPFYKKLSNTQIQQTLDAMIYSVHIGALPKALRSYIQKLDISTILKEDVSPRLERAETRLIKAIREGSQEDINTSIGLLKAAIAKESAVKKSIAYYEEFVKETSSLKEAATLQYSIFGYSLGLDDIDVYKVKTISEASEDVKSLIQDKLDIIRTNPKYTNKGGLYDRLSLLAKEGINPFYVPENERHRIDRMDENKKEFEREKIKAFHESVDYFYEIANSEMKDNVGNVTVDVNNVTIQDDILKRLLYRMSLTDLGGKDLQALIMGLTGEDIIGNNRYDIPDPDKDTVPMLKLLDDIGFVMIDMESFFRSNTSEQLPYQIALRKYHKVEENGKLKIVADDTPLVIYLNRGKISTDSKNVKTTSKNYLIDGHTEPWEIINENSLNRYHSLLNSSTREEVDATTGTRFIMVDASDPTTLASELNSLLSGYCDRDINGTATRLPVATYNGANYDLPLLTKLLTPGVTEGYQELSDIQLIGEFFENRTAVDIYSILKESNFNLPELNNSPERRYTMEVLADILKLKQDGDGDQHDALIDIEYQARLLEKMANSQIDMNEMSKGLLSRMKEVLTAIGYEGDMENFIRDNISFKAFADKIYAEADTAGSKFLDNYRTLFTETKKQGTTIADYRLKRILNILQDIDYNNEFRHQRAERRKLLETLEGRNSSYINFLVNEGGSDKINTVMAKILDHMPKMAKENADDNTRKGAFGAAIDTLSEAIMRAAGMRESENASYNTDAFFENNDVDTCVSKILTHLPKEWSDTEDLSGGADMWAQFQNNPHLFVRPYDDNGNIDFIADISDIVQETRLGWVAASRAKTLEDAIFNDPMFEGEGEIIKNLLINNLLSFYGDTWDEHNIGLLTDSVTLRAKRHYQDSAYSKQIRELVRTWGDACLGKYGLYNMISAKQVGEPISVLKYTDKLGSTKDTNEKVRRGVIYMSPQLFEKFYGEDYQTVRNGLGISSDQPLYGRVMRHPGAKEDVLHIYEIAISEDVPALAMTPDEFFVNQAGDFDGDHIIFERPYKDIQMLGEMRAKNVATADTLASSVLACLYGAPKQQSKITVEITDAFKKVLKDKDVSNIQRTFNNAKDAKAKAEELNYALKVSLAKILEVSVDDLDTKPYEDYFFKIAEPQNSQQTTSSDGTYRIYSHLISLMYPDDEINNATYTYLYKPTLIKRKLLAMVDQSTGAGDKLKYNRSLFAGLDDEISSENLFRYSPFDLTKETRKAFASAWNADGAKDKNGFREKIAAAIKAPEQFKEFDSQEALEAVLLVVRSQYNTSNKEYQENFSTYLKAHPETFESTRKELQEKLKLLADYITIEGVKPSAEITQINGDISTLSLTELRDLEHSLVMQLYNDKRRELYYESNEYTLGREILHEVAQACYHGIAPYTKTFGSVGEWSESDTNTSGSTYIRKRFLVVDDKDIPADTFGAGKNSFKDMKAIKAISEEVGSRKFTSEFKDFLAKNYTGAKSSAVIPYGLKVYKNDDTDYTGLTVSGLMHNQNRISLEDIDDATDIIFTQTLAGKDFQHTPKICIPGSNVGKSTQGFDIKQRLGKSFADAMSNQDRHFDFVLGEFDITKVRGISEISELEPIEIEGKKYRCFEAPVGIAEAEGFYESPVKSRMYDTITTVNAAHSPEGLLLVGGLFLDISDTDLRFNSKRLTEVNEMMAQMKNPTLMAYNGARNYSGLLYTELLKGITDLSAKEKLQLLTRFHQAPDAGGSWGYAQISKLIDEYYSNESGRAKLISLMNKDDYHKALFSQQLREKFVRSSASGTLTTMENALAKLPFPKSTKSLEGDIFLTQESRPMSTGLSRDAYMRSGGRMDTTSGYYSNLGFINILLKALNSSAISQTDAQQGSEIGVFNTVNMVRGNQPNGFHGIALNDSVEIPRIESDTQMAKIGADASTMTMKEIVIGANQYGPRDDINLQEGTFGTHNITSKAYAKAKEHFHVDGTPKVQGYKAIQTRNRLIQSTIPASSRLDLAHRLSDFNYDNSVIQNFAPTTIRVQGNNLQYSMVPTQSRVTMEEYARYKDAYTGSPLYFDRRAKRYRDIVGTKMDNATFTPGVSQEVFNKLTDLRDRYAKQPFATDDTIKALKAIEKTNMQLLQEQEALRAQGYQALRNARDYFEESEDYSVRNYSLLYDTPFETKKSWLSSSGIKLDSEEGIMTDRLLQQYKMRRNTSYNAQFGARLDTLKQIATNLMSLNLPGDAYNINKYIAYKSLLGKIEYWTRNSTNKSTQNSTHKYPDRDHGMQMDVESSRHIEAFTKQLGVTIEEAQNYINNFENTNATAIFVNTLNSLTQDFYLAQHKIDVVTGNPLPDSFWFISTVVSGDKDADKANFNASFKNILKNPFGYDKTPLKLIQNFYGYTESSNKQFSQDMPHYWDDIEFFKTFETRAKELCSIQAIVDLSQQLKATGAMANAKVQDIVSDENVYKVLKKAALLGTTSTDSSTDMHYANYLFTATSIVNKLGGSKLHVNTDNNVRLGQRYLQLFEGLKSYIIECSNPLGKPEGTTITLHEAIEGAKETSPNKAIYEDIIFAYQSMGDIAARLCMIDTKNETTATLLDDIYNKFMSENSGYAIVDQFGREITKDLKDFRALSAHSFDDLAYIGKKAIKLEGTFEQQVALEILMGDVYIMDKNLAKNLKDNVFVKRNPRLITKFINAVRNYTMKYIMSNPTKAVGRFINFSNFDVVNNLMVSPSSALQLKRAAKEVSTYFASKGAAASPELEEFIRITAMSPGTGVYQGEAFTSKSRGPLKGYFNTMTDIFNMQSMFTRYALWLDLKQVQTKKGDIPAWRLGSSYHYKDKMGKIQGDRNAGITPEGAKAMFIISNQYGSPGDMPYLASKLSEKGFVFTTFPLALTRFAKDSAFSSVQAVKDVFNQELRSSAFKYLGYQGISSACTLGIIAAIYYFLLSEVLDDEDEEDEETLEEFLTNGYGLDLFQSLIQDDLVPSQGAQASPWQAIINSTYTPIKEGMDNAENVGMDEGSFYAGALNWLNTQIISKFNPIITTPLNAIPSPDDEDDDGKADIKNIGDALAVLDTGGMQYPDSYNSFLDNLSRETLGIMMGSTAANTLLNDMEATSESDKNTAQRVVTGMSKALSAEMGNTKTYKNNKKNYSKALRIIKAYQKETDITRIESGVTGTYEEALQYIYQLENGKTADAANTLYDKLNTARTSKASAEDISALIDAARQQGVNEYQIKSALKSVSIRVKLEEMNNIDDFLNSLSESEYNSIMIALAYEDTMFPIFNSEYDSIVLAEEYAKQTEERAKAQKDSTNDAWYDGIYTWKMPTVYESAYYPKKSYRYNNYRAYQRDRSYHNRNYYSDNYTPVSTYNYLVNKLK